MTSTKTRPALSRMPGIWADVNFGGGGTWPGWHPGARGSALRDACPAPLLPSSRVSAGCRHVFKTPQTPRSSRSLRRVRWHLCGLTLPLYSVDCKLRHLPRCPCGPQVAQRAPRPADSLGALPTRAVVPGVLPSFLSRTGFSRRFSPFLLLGSAMSRSLQGGTSAY